MAGTTDEKGGERDDAREGRRLRHEGVGVDVEARDDAEDPVLVLFTSSDAMTAPRTGPRPLGELSS